MAIDIYIDALLGSDTSGDGSTNSPYKTFVHFATNVATKQNATYDIYLGEGDYSFTRACLEYFQQSTIRVIGKGSKTVFMQDGQLGPNSSGIGYATTTFSFIKLIYTTNIKVDTINCNCFHWEWKFYNVLFRNIPHDRGAGYSTLGFFIPNSKPMEFRNCVKEVSTVGFFRTTNSTINVYDSAGPFTSGYGTSDGNWNKAGNYIGAVTLDGGFNITNVSHQGLMAGDWMWEQRRYAVFNDGTVKVMVENEWIPIDSINIEEDWMDKLDSRFIKKDTQSMSQVENGVFSHTISMKKNIDIRKIKVTGGD